MCLAFAVVAGLACGSSGGGDEPAAGMPGAAVIGTEPFDPLAVGSTWTYRVTDPMLAPTYKVVTILGMEMPGGTGPNAATAAVKHHTCKGARNPSMCVGPRKEPDTLDQTIGWVAPMDGPNGGHISANLQEQSFRTGTLTATELDWWDPYRIKFDATPEHTVQGARWTETFTETKKPLMKDATVDKQSITWKVESVTENVTVTDLTGSPRTYTKCIRVSHTTGAGGLKNFWYCRGIGKVKETGGQTEELVDYALK
jgi:hypothetical protein